MQYLRRRDVYLELGDVDSAIADQTSAIALEPDSAIQWAMRGELYHKKGDYKNAINDFTASLERNPKGTGWISRCTTRAVANMELSLALADCDKAIELKQFHLSVYDRRALVFYRMERFSEAIENYDEELKRSPNDAHSLYGRGLAKIKLGDQRGGAADIAAAKKIHSEIDAVYRRYGIDR